MSLSIRSSIVTQNYAIEGQNLNYSVSTRLGQFTPILKDCSIRIPSGQLWMLLGPNGCGKSTLLKVYCSFIVSSPPFFFGYGLVVLLFVILMCLVEIKIRLLFWICFLETKRKKSKHRNQKSVLRGMECSNWAFDFTCVRAGE